MSLEFILAPGEPEETTLTQSEVIRYNAVKTHTGIGSLRATVATTETLLDLARVEARLDIQIDGTTEWTGFLNTVKNSTRDGTTRIKGFGIGRRLEKTRPDYQNLSGERVTYSQTALEDALRDYWGRTEFSNYTVTDEPTEIVEDDVLLRLADDNTSWSSGTTLSDTARVFIDGGSLKLAQSAFVFEGESKFLSGTFSDPNYSDGDATGIDTGISSTSDSATYTFTPNYTIPENNVKVKFRIDLIDGDSDGDITPPQTEVTLNGNTIFGPNQFLASQTTGLRWDDFNTDGEYSGGDLTAGNSVDLTIEVTDGTVGDSDDRINFDVVCVYDDRFSYTFDNSVDANGYLSGPALYPTSETIQTNGDTTDLNIKSLNLDTTWNNVSGDQQIGVSNDGGSTYTTADNQSDVDVTFTSGGRTHKVQLRLDGYGTRTTATPTEDHLGQEVSRLELRGDLDNLTVIDELELTNSHFANLQTLHDYGNYLWVIEHDSSDIANLVVSSFQEGTETRPPPSAYDDPIDKESSIDVRNYFNDLFFYGARNDNDNYPHVEVSDQDEINDVGETVSATLHDPNVTTFAGARFRANSLLAELTDENERKGEITIPLRAEVIHPGYAREIDFGDGSKLKTIEEVTLTESQEQLAQTHTYTPPDNVASEIEQLKRNARDVRDKV